MHCVPPHGFSMEVLMKRVLMAVAAVVALGALVSGQAANDTAIERPFAEGGAVRLVLSSGDYTLRAGAGDRLVVRWDADDEARVSDLKALSVDVHVSGTIATILTDGPAKHAHFTIEMPARTDLRLRMRAGEVRIDGIEGHKDIRMTAGDLTIGVLPASLARAHASVTFGDLQARPLGISKSGIKRSLDWTGAGRYALDARLGAGELSLTHQR
jgi:hypothetical protein